ncbi:MAG: DUF1624 domain-containing protein [Candidatus Lokiarchaeota archaeon]|nr:DUF1624 domain-containing protein [Candidatus Lokiarchaeota archaeon]
MSLEEENEVDLDSIPLFDYLKKAIPVEELRDFSSSRRIRSIDFVKGVAIIFIILAHTAGAWLVPSWKFLYGIVFAFLDILGPSLFVFLSALSVVFSIRRRKKSTREKVIRNRIFSRGLMIIVIAVIFNLVSIEFTIPGYSFPATLWGWNILMFIGISQIFSYYALKLSKVARAIIGLITIFTSDAVRQFLFQGKEAGDLLSTILHYIITSPSPMTPLLPWISICFISSIFGEYLYEAMMGGTKKDYRKLFRTFLYWGIFLVLTGVFLGRNSYVPGVEFLTATDFTIGTLPLSEYPHIALLPTANIPTFIHNITYPGMWEFLIRGRAPNMIYNLGAALILIAVCFYIVDIKRKMNNFISMMNYYGKVSLSLFLLHFVFITIFLDALDLFRFIVVIFGYLGFWGLTMYLWNEFYNGVGSPEWLMVQVGRIGQKTGKTVKKEILIIEEEIKETVHKIKKDQEEDTKN